MGDIKEIIERLEFELYVLEFHNRTHKPVKHITGGVKNEIELIEEIITDTRDVLNKIKKVGDTVWVIFQPYKSTKPIIESRKVLSVQFYYGGATQYHYKDGCFYQDHIGKTVFLTKEEATQALKARANK